jgi:hypothetical protein
MSEEMHELDRREIFFKLVRMQDEGASVDGSRTRIAAEFSIDVDVIQEIEVEGMEKNWPPL